MTTRKILIKEMDRTGRAQSSHNIDMNDGETLCNYDHENKRRRTNWYGQGI